MVGDVEVTTGTQSDESTLFATYAIGGATAGFKNQREIMQMHLMSQLDWYILCN